MEIFIKKLNYIKNNTLEILENEIYNQIVNLIDTFNKWLDTAENKIIN